jgi:hypothetical protein
MHLFLLQPSAPSRRRTRLRYDAAAKESPGHQTKDTSYSYLRHVIQGYGTKLMNLVKQIGAERGIEYFITYAGGQTNTVPHAIVYTTTASHP